MPKALPYLRILPLVVAGFLPLLLFVSISGCTVSAGAPAATQELPTLQAILPFDTPALNPKYVSVLPGGYTYVTEVNFPLKNRGRIKTLVQIDVQTHLG